MAQFWYAHAYRRNVVDMHITDDDPQFMTRIDPKRYAAMLKKSGVQSAVVYAHSHVGHTYYPTKVGHTHGNLQGRDLFGELVAECHREKIAVQAYYSLIFNTWAYRAFPDWRIIDVNGRGHGDSSRYGVCCPNSPYRDHVAAQVEELCTAYPFEGIRFDMTFWPAVCYCPHCARRFAEEVGGELPRTIDWTDRRWTAFQRARERWLVDFAALATATVRRFRPEVSVEHQASAYPLTWQFGVSVDLVEHNDFLQGDFYGGALQGSFVCKLLADLTPNQPFAFETSIALGLGDHTSIKPEHLLEAKACRAISNGGGFVFIDAIDPVGTLDRRRYERMGRVFARTSRFDPYLGGRMVHDVGIYMSTESKHDPDDTGRKPTEGSHKTPHVSACLGAAEAMIEANIPYGVVTRKGLDRLSRFSILVLPNVLMMSEQEAEAIRQYVRQGGCVYASRFTSLTTPDGARQRDFLLADVFGATFDGETKEAYTYIAPTGAGKRVLDQYDDQYPLGMANRQVMIQPHESAKVLGRLALPYTDPADPQRFASIHSNPPGRPTDRPAIVLHRFGKGRAIYAAADLESLEDRRWVFANLIRSLAPRRGFAFESDAPKPVELTLFDQPERSRMILHVLNFQEPMPNIPVNDIHVRVRLDDRALKAVTEVPSRKKVRFKISKGFVEFAIDRLETFRMFELRCR
ncbi:MAG: hypothetical protein GXY33_15790 [Phycisphaerae bacterium]|nr:hypothetical protein [Phycisphaerae bacterium]